MFLPYMYMHAYTIHAFTLYAGGGGWGGGGGGGAVPINRSKGYILYMYFLLRVLYYTCIYTCIYTHIVYILLRVECTYAQLIGNRRLAKSLIDRSIVSFWGLFYLAVLFRNFKYDVIEAKPPYYILLIINSLIKFNWWVHSKIWQWVNAIISFGFTIQKKFNYFYIG